jgi:hypothetical protein
MVRMGVENNAEVAQRVVELPRDNLVLDGGYVESGLLNFCTVVHR